MACSMPALPAMSLIRSATAISWSITASWLLPPAMDGGAGQAPGKEEGEEEETPAMPPPGGWEEEAASLFLHIPPCSAFERRARARMRERCETRRRRIGDEGSWEAREEREWSEEEREEGSALGLTHEEGEGREEKGERANKRGWHLGVAVAAAVSGGWLVGCVKQQGRRWERATRRESMRDRNERRRAVRLEAWKRGGTRERKAEEREDKREGADGGVVAMGKNGNEGVVEAVEGEVKGPWFGSAPWWAAICCS